jgi:hypothetical protein
MTEVRNRIRRLPDRFHLLRLPKLHPVNQLAGNVARDEEEGFLVLGPTGILNTTARLNGGLRTLEIRAENSAFRP